MKIPKLNWILFDKDNPPTDLLEEKEYLILLREDNYNNGATWTYHVDVATPYGSYLDNFWNTTNDWDEGQLIEVVMYAEPPYGLKEEEDLIDTDAIEKRIRNIVIEAVGKFIHSSVRNGTMNVEEYEIDDWLDNNPNWIGLCDLLSVKED